MQSTRGVERVDTFLPVGFSLLTEGSNFLRRLQFKNQRVYITIQF